MSAPVLDVRRIVRRFGELRAVDEVAFHVGPGEICGFIGPNGAGKTTTLRICATLDLPDEGDVHVAGVSVLEDPRGARRRLGFMPDAVEMEPYTPVRDWLDFHARACCLSGPARRRVLEEVVAFTGLEPLLDKESAVLSKGNAQRLLLARTLLHDPALLLLDEPAAGLDPRARVELRELVRALARRGKAVLLSSHILSELGELCDTVAIIERGRVRAFGPVSEIVGRVSGGRSSVFVRALADPAALERALAEHPAVDAQRPREDGVVVELRGGDEAAAALLEHLVGAGLRPVAFTPVTANLEDAFLHLTEGRLA